MSKEELKQKAIKFRKQGQTYSEILEQRFLLRNLPSHYG